MAFPWGVTGVSIFVVGVGLVFSTGRVRSYYKPSHDEGREFLWKERYRLALGELLVELDSEIDLGDELDEISRWKSNGYQAPPDGSRSNDETFGSELGRKIPYTKNIREYSDELRAKANELNRLEKHFRELETHQERVGGCLVGLGLAAGIYALLSEDPNITLGQEHFLVIWLITAIIFFYGSKHAFQYIYKIKTVNDTSAKQDKSQL